MRRRSKALLALIAALGLAGCGTPRSAGGHGATPNAPSSSASASPTPKGRPSQSTASSATPGLITTAQANNTGMQAIDFMNAHRGFLAGHGGIWKTTDGGRQWAAVSRDSANFQNIQFVNNHVGWAWGYRTLVATTNGGNTWQIRYHNASPIISASMTGSESGYAVMGTPSAPLGAGGPGNRLYQTTDGGEHWQTVAAPFHPMAVAFWGKLTGWVVGNSNVWKTTDGGKQWTAVYHFAHQVPMAAQIKLAGPDDVWIVLDGESGMSQTSYTVIRHTLHGHWRVVAAKSTAGAGPAPDAPAAAPGAPETAPGPWAVVNRHTAFLGGVSSALNMGTTAIWSTLNGGENWNQYQPIYGANGIPGPSALSFVNSKQGWLVDGGVKTQVFETTNGGISWRQIFPTAPSPVEGISFVTPSTGYGVGQPGHPNQIVVTHNGGRLWSPLSRLPSSSRWQFDYVHPVIAFTSPQVGWVVRNNHLWKTQNGGKTWTQQSLPHYTAHIRLNSVAFAGQDGVAGSLYPNSSWWTADGGSTWNYAQNENFTQALATLNPAMNRELSHVGQNVVSAGGYGTVAWILFQNRTWALSTNHSQSWTVHTLPVNTVSYLGTLSFVNARDGWGQSITGRIVRTIDGGLSWTRAG